MHPDNRPTYHVKRPCGRCKGTGIAVSGRECGVCKGKPHRWFEVLAQELTDAEIGGLPPSLARRALGEIQEQQNRNIRASRSANYIAEYGEPETDREREAFNVYVNVA